MVDLQENTRTHHEMR